MSRGSEGAVERKEQEQTRAMTTDAVAERDRLVCLGVITGPHGIRGHVRVKSYTEAPADIARYGPLADSAGGRALRLTVTGRSRTLLIAAVDGVGDRNGAEALAGRQLFVPRAVLPTPGDEEYYHADLIGLTAVTGEDGSTLGTVRGVFDFGAGDVLEVVCEAGGTVMVPFTRDAVPHVDLTGRRLLVADLAGMLEGGAGEDAPDAAGEEGARAEAPAAPAP